MSSSAKLPAIVFAMSRKKCVEGAHACAPLNLIGGQRPGKRDAPGEDASEEERDAWDRAENQRRSSVKAVQRAIQAMHRLHLQRYVRPSTLPLRATRPLCSS